MCVFFSVIAETSCDGYQPSGARSIVKKLQEENYFTLQLHVTLRWKNVCSLSGNNVLAIVRTCIHFSPLLNSVISS